MLGTYLLGLASTSAICRLTVLIYQLSEELLLEVVDVLVVEVASFATLKSERPLPVIRVPTSPTNVYRGMPLYVY
jgi:hypothetical protein